MKQILIVDDQQDIRLSASLVLTHHGYKCLEADSPLQALAIIEQQQIDLLLLDMNFNKDTTSGEEGLALLKQLSEMNLSLPIVVMTAWASVDIAVQAMQLGAGDFVEKPWQNNRLLSIVKHQLENAHLSQENKRFSQLQRDGENTPAPLAVSDIMQQLMAQAKRVAQTDASILITGDNGTGKSMLASYIHACSSRANARFVSTNMGAIPDSLFESELFGHKRGAFTDAKEDRLGRFDLAQDGTLFLDEIGTLPGQLQSKLLRVLETGEYESLGSSRTMRTNARIITATNADLSQLISAGQFRKDLLYRLNTVQLHVPALSERVQDILPLAEHFLAQHAARYHRLGIAFTEFTKQALLEYPWPGNVRELSHCIERAVILASGDSIDVKDLALERSQAIASNQSELMTFEDGERRVLKAALTHYRGNVVSAAEYLGLSKSAMYRRLEKLSIEPKEFAS